MLKKSKKIKFQLVFNKKSINLSLLPISAVDFTFLLIFFQLIIQY